MMCNDGWQKVGAFSFMWD